MKKSKLAIFGGKPVLKEPFKEYNTIGNQELKAATKVMKNRVISDFLGAWNPKFFGGEYIQKLELMVSKKFSIKHAVSFNSATTALQAAVAAAGVGPGDEVITSPYTMSATASSILLNGAVPVFADINDKTFSLDVESVKKNITKNTKAIIVVNIFGGSTDFKKILPLARKHNLVVIEDNAQGIGGKYKNKFLGTIGDIGVISFNVHKALQSGEGGILITNNKKFAWRAQLVRNHGEVAVDTLYSQGEKYEPIVGSNYRMSELHAAVAIEQLKKINELVKPRIVLSDYLTKKLIKFNFIQTLEKVPNSIHVCYLYPFRFIAKHAPVKRETFAKAMELEGFPLSIGYEKPIYLMSLYQKKKMYPNSNFPFEYKNKKSKVSYKKGICPNVEKLHFKELLDTNICNSQRTKKDIDLFIRAIEKVEQNFDELVKIEKNS
jgi:perosamine synthetase